MRALHLNKPTFLNTRTQICIFVKESLNSDGEQFHQYQQNGQPPLTITSHLTTTSHLTITSDLKQLNTKKTTTYGVGNPGSGLRIYKNMTELNRVPPTLNL